MCIMSTNLLQVKCQGAIKFHETHEVRGILPFPAGTHCVSLWQISTVLNNWVYVTVRCVEGLQKLFLKELSIIALAMNPYTFRSCSVCTRALKTPRCLCHSPAQVVS